MTFQFAWPRPNTHSRTMQNSKEYLRGSLFRSVLSACPQGRASYIPYSEICKPCQDSVPDQVSGRSDLILNQEECLGCSRCSLGSLISQFQPRIPCICLNVANMDVLSTTYHTSQLGFSSNSSRKSDNKLRVVKSISRHGRLLLGTPGSQTSTLTVMCVNVVLDCNFPPVRITGNV